MDSHNKSCQSDIALEKFWVTRCGWLWLCTSVAMGITINNFWKLFRFGFKRNHYDNFIGIRKFSERIAVDCLGNNFTTDTGTPENNIPSLDDIDNEVTVYTCWRLNYSSSSPRNSEIRMIPDIMIATAPTTDIGCTDSKAVELEGGG